MNYALVNGCLLDGSRHMAPQTGLAVLTGGERIVAIVPQRESFPNYKTVDLQGGYLMPGLINLHAHLPAAGKPHRLQPDPPRLLRMALGSPLSRRALLALCEESARTELFSGVTTLRTLGGILDCDTRLRDRIAQGRADGPRLLAANMGITVTGGHMAGPLAYPARSADEVPGYVERIAAEGADVIKLIITGGVLDARVKGEPGEVRMPASYVRAACETAHRLGLPVAAHAESPEGLRLALENGVDTVEHGAVPGPELLELFRQSGACQVATFSPAVPFALFDREATGASPVERYNSRLVLKGIVRCARACLAEGIPVGLGTDAGCPFVTHYDFWRELQYFRRFCGVSNAFALHTATQVNARLLGLERVTGTVREGLCADLLATRENPLVSLTALREPLLVMARGRLYPHPRIRKYAPLERRLDTAL